jgi:hypothetical protein
VVGYYAIDPGLPPVTDCASVAGHIRPAAQTELREFSIMATAAKDIELYEETDPEFAKSWLEGHRDDLEALRRFGMLVTYDDQTLFREGPFPQDDGPVVFRVYMAPAGVMCMTTLLRQDSFAQPHFQRILENIAAERTTEAT